MEQTKLKAPFGWIGGKKKLAKEIIGLMPSHIQYVEVFGGAASVLYQKEKSKLEIINDINGDLINLHRIISTRPISLKNELNNMLLSREIFNNIKNKVWEPRNNIQKAAWFYYLITNSFSSNCKNFAMCKLGPRDQIKTRNLYKDFSIYAQRLKGVIIENSTYEKLIKNYDSKETLFYLDPPYLGTEKYYIMYKEFNLAEHKKLANILRQLKGKFILSYNDCMPIKELYKGFNFKEISIIYSLNAKSPKQTKELIITNYDT